MMFSAETGLSETLLGPAWTPYSLVNKQVDPWCVYDDICGVCMLKSVVCL